jgi:hypothetical protein
MGGTSSQNASHPWPGSGRPGYIRSGSKGGIEEFGLRTDIGKNNGVTTYIGADTDVERGPSRSPSGRSKNRNAGPLSNNHSGWNNSESKLTEVSSEDEPSWESGIRKTTVSTQTAL